MLALELCRKMGIATIASPAKPAAQCALCDYLISIPSVVTMHIQEAHLALEHIFCMMVERFYFAPSQSSPLGASAAIEE